VIAAAVFLARWFMWRQFVGLAATLGMHCEAITGDDELIIWTGRNEAGSWVA
jgi:hypothetical protein